MKKITLALALLSISLTSIAIASQPPAKPLQKAPIFTSTAQCESFLQNTIQDLPTGNLDNYAWFFHYSQSGTSALTLGQYHYIDTDNTGTPNQGTCALFSLQKMPEKFIQEAVNSLNNQINYYNQSGEVSQKIGASSGLKCPVSSASNLNNCQLIQA
ncbi:hypothetical protein OAO18_05945 [Francisellaceae bacterium]|nr:hypothetical protein [Francisellaceae bacterium]